MSCADTPLTLERASFVLPESNRSIVEWQIETATILEGTSPNRLLACSLFDQVGLKPNVMCANLTVSKDKIFLDANGHTSRDLAHQALSNLMTELPDDDAKSRCTLLLHSSASIDEHYHQSLVGWLASIHGMSKLPHCSVSQLQGASFAGAVDIIDAMLLDDGYAAAYVTTERWPTPFPRYFPDAGVLADGAAALWFVRGATTGLQLAGVRSQSFASFIKTTGGDFFIDKAALVKAAVAVITALCNEMKLTTRDIGIWLPSGLAAEIEEAVREGCGITTASFVVSVPNDGYLCTTATPALCASVLGQISRSKLAHGTLVLAWGASFGGGIGVSLWRVATQVG